MNKKTFYQLSIVFALLLTIIFGVVAYSFYNSGENNQQKSQSQVVGYDKIETVVSVYPAYLIAKEIIKDRANLNLVAKGSGDPHTFEPSSQDVKSILESDFFIYSGQGFDEWAEKIVESENIKSLALTANLDLLKNEEGEEKEEAHEGEEKEAHGEFDPHFWLSPQKVIRAGENIKNEFVALDSQNKEFYQTNYESFKIKIESLDRQIKDGLTSCNTNKIITSHDAFGYLADSYGFEVVAIAGLEPTDEPSPSKLAEIANQVKAENIKYILYETQIDDGFAKTLATETGAQTLVLNSMESPVNDDFEKGKTYNDYMLENLSTLQKALNCF